MDTNNFNDIMKSKTTLSNGFSFDFKIYSTEKTELTGVGRLAFYEFTTWISNLTLKTVIASAIDIIKFRSEARENETESNKIKKN